MVIYECCKFPRRSENCNITAHAFWKPKERNITKFQHRSDFVVFDSRPSVRTAKMWHPLERAVSEWCHHGCAACILNSSRHAIHRFSSKGFFPRKKLKSCRRRVHHFAMAALFVCAKSGEHQGLSRSLARAPRRRGPAPSPQSKGLGVSEPMRTGPASTRRARSRVQPWEDAHRLTPAARSQRRARHVEKIRIFIHDGSFVFSSAVERNRDDSERGKDKTVLKVRAHRLPAFFLEVPLDTPNYIFSLSLCACARAAVAWVWLIARRVAFWIWISLWGALSDCGYASCFCSPFVAGGGGGAIS